MQNQPSEAKKIFVAPQGWKFIQFDFTNLELVVLAYVAGIKHLINVFQNGLNVHDENTKLFLGITPDDPNWKMWRRVMMIFL
jgi:DNA polymerase-1